MTHGTGVTDGQRWLTGPWPVALDDSYSLDHDHWHWMTHHPIELHFIGSMCHIQYLLNNSQILSSKYCTHKVSHLWVTTFLLIVTVNFESVWLYFPFLYHAVHIVTVAVSIHSILIISVRGHINMIKSQNQTKILAKQVMNNTKTLTVADWTLQSKCLVTDFLLNPQHPWHSQG